MKNQSKLESSMSLCICNAPLNSGKAIAALDYIATLQKPFKVSASKSGVKVTRKF